MSSQTFLPILSPPSSPSPVLRPRRPSLEPEREILSTRGQHVLNLFPSRTSSLALHDLDDDTPERRLILRRGSLLIGHSNPRYEWYSLSFLPGAMTVLTRAAGNATTNHPSH